MLAIIIKPPRWPFSSEKDEQATVVPCVVTGMKAAILSLTEPGDYGADPAAGLRPVLHRCTQVNGRNAVLKNTADPRPCRPLSAYNFAQMEAQLQAPASS